MSSKADKPKRKRIPEWFTWTVEFKVHKTWVEDGFDLDDDRAKDMIESDLTWADGWETKARVLSSPDKDLVRRVQGYDPEATND